MKIQNLHSFSVDLESAQSIQDELAQKIKLQPLKKDVKFIAGADVAYFDKKWAIAAVTVMEFPALNIVEQKFALAEVNFPYIPGYLTFREAPALIPAFEKLEIEPDVIIFVGQGIAHRKKMGIAAHMGVFLNLPTIGCAKKRLVGEYVAPVAKKGEISALNLNGEPIGAVVCTRDGTKPVFVSAGHKITLKESIEYVLKCCTKYRLPEPVRQSHIAVTKIRANIRSVKDVSHLENLYENG